MNKLEWKRFFKFWLKHPFSYVKTIYPSGAGYYLIAKSLFSKYEENITDIDNMFENF